MFTSDQRGFDGLDGQPDVHRCRNNTSSLKCQKSDSISERQISRFKDRQRRGRLKMGLTSAFIVLAFTAVVVEGRPQLPEDLKQPSETYDFDFGRRVIARDSRPKLIPEQASTLETLKSSRVRKRNFSVLLPSERTLDIRDSKKDNQLEQDRGKDENASGSEDDTKNTLYPAPPFTTFRSTLQTKRNFSSKSSDWIPLTSSPIEVSLNPSPTEASPSTTFSTTRRQLNTTKPADHQTTATTTNQLPLSTTARTLLPQKRNLTDPTSESSVSESNVSVQTTRPDTPEPQLSFGSRTSLTKTTVKIIPAVNVTSTANPIKSSTTGDVPNFAGRTTKTPPTADAQDSVRLVLKRPPVQVEVTTRGKLHSQDSQGEPVTPAQETTRGTTQSATSSTTTTSSPLSTTTTTGQEVVNRTRVRLRDSLVTQFQGAPSAHPVAPRNFNTSRTTERVTTTDDSNNTENPGVTLQDAQGGKSSEAGVEKTPLSAPLIGLSPENYPPTTDKRVALVRSRTTVAKLQTTTTEIPPATSSATASSTTLGSLDDVQEESYTDRRLVELAHSEPGYPGTERDSPEAETNVPVDQNTFRGDPLAGPEVESKESGPPVVERPAGLQKELLAAIRRKITQNRSSVTTTATTATTTTTTAAPTTTTSEAIVVEDLGTLTFDNDVSPDLNLISSTQHPSFFKPISFPGPADNSGSSSSESGQSKVQFFVRVPNSKPGSSVKIPDIAHIQGKLARLNTAITEGLQEQRRQQQVVAQAAAGASELESIVEALPLPEEVVPTATTVQNPSAVPTDSQIDDDDEVVITSTSISSIFSVVTGSPSVRLSPPLVTTGPPTSTSTTQIAPPKTLAPTTTPRSDRGSPETSGKASVEAATELSVETTSRASSVSEIITVGKNDLKNPDAQSTQKPLEPIVAQKTYTYLDRLRERQLVTTTSTPPTTSQGSPSTPAPKPKTTTTKKPEIVYEIEPKPKDHPTSHYRPETESKKSGLPKVGNVEIVTPSVGDYNRGAVQGKVSLSSKNKTELLGAKDEPAIQDATGTTVYVVGVICIIPAAGLVAWIVRYALRKKDLTSSESGSETGLNCPGATPSDEEVMPGQIRPINPGPQAIQQQQQLDQLIMEPDDVDLSETTAIRDALSNSKWHIVRKNLTFQTVLGEGNFGKVWKAEAENICGYDGTILVAVKTTKENAPEKEKTDLLQEMKIMQTVGHHPNVVTLLGVCTEKEPYLLVMEYVMYGKLLTHLRDQRSRQVSLFQFSEADLQGEPGDQARISSKDLTKYAYGVAKGMEFLVSKGIIHRDLAARNILVDHNCCCKISDFGLSRNLGDTGSEMYEQKTKGALPIRWMAPESLYFSVFTPKSDVWSFGILMWEIVTLGSTPYPGMGAREVMRRVRDGYRLERPSHCHPDLYKIISKCWAGDMNKRPDFTELRQELAKLLEDQHGYIDLYNIPENKYYSMTQSSNEEEKL